MLFNQLAQQPSFLEGRTLAAVVEAMREHQRVGLGHLEHRDIDEVTGELGEGRDADVAVEQDPARVVAHDQHGRQLPVLEQRRDQPTLSALVDDPQRRVAQIQVAEFELHRPSTLGRPGSAGDGVFQGRRG
ncbi:hypothetical protein ENSA7_25120 [Enhygromyxa salina]|uniref:Uncharacterized protein n=1 Tax=Enhygromyxa salina TaxID=215803 RepID=A0A2S9YS09_9BACT|nr:hypothetical protein ENSA7_25120 [Enhygromyxa salina]